MQAQPLVGTEGGAFPFWSPDSRYVGFFAGGKLKKVEASGGPPLTLCDAPSPRGGSWGRDGVIIFTPSLNTPLYRVSDSGGVATPVTELDLKKNQTTHRWPYFLPDRHHFLFVSGTPFLPRENPTNAIEVGSLDSKERKFLMFTHAGAAYAAGHIFFLRQNTLMAQPFDPKDLVFTGDASPVADPVFEDTGTVRSVFSVSEGGTLAYVEGSSAAARKLIWVDRAGKKVAEIEGAEAYLWPNISRDGKKIAYTLESPAYDIWGYDIGRGVKTRLTFGSATAEVVEAVNALGEEFGEARLGQFITACQDLQAEQFAERLLDEVLGWPGKGSKRQQADDITLVVIDVGNMP